MVHLFAFVVVCASIAINAQLIDDELIDNSISSGIDSAKPKPQIDWVKISESPPPKVVQNIGSTIELECEAIGSPPPSIYWVRGNNHQALVRYICGFNNTYWTWILYCIR